MARDAPGTPRSPAVRGLIPRPVERSGRAAPRFAAAAAGFLLLAEFLLLARLRLLDADEGWELMAARLVAGGRRLYVDFFSQQMPLLPYLYGAWGRVAGTGWAGGRLLSGLLAWASGMLVYRIASRRSGAGWGAAAAAAFGLNALVFSWLPCVKTFALTTVLLLAAWELMDDARGRVWCWVVSGCCAGLAMETRLFVVAAVPVVLLAGSGPRRRAAAWFAPGCAVAFLPAARPWVEDPSRLWYMNLGYHLTRSDLDAVAATKQKLAMFLEVAGLGDGFGAAGTQTLVLLVVTGVLGWRLRRVSQWPAAFWMAAVLGFVSLLPTPAYAQYACVPMPFLILGATQLAASAGSLARSPWLAALAGVYGLAAPIEWHRVTHSGAGLPAVDRAPNWTIRSAGRVAAILDREIAAPGEPVLSWWPGYLIGSAAAPVPGQENQFALSAGRRVAPAAHPDWHLIDPPAIEGMIRAGRPRLCVVGSWMLDMQRAPVRALLARSGYRVIETVHDIEIWRRGPAARP